MGKDAYKVNLEKMEIIIRINDDCEFRGEVGDLENFDITIKDNPAIYEPKFPLRFNPSPTINIALKASLSQLCVKMGRANWLKWLWYRLMGWRRHKVDIKTSDNECPQCEFLYDTCMDSPDLTTREYWRLLLLWQKGNI